MSDETRAVGSPMGEKGVQLNNVADAWNFAKTVATSGLAPKSMNTPEKILIAMQTGMEVGLSPMRAINSVVVINGAPAWKGDAAAALILDSGKADTPFTTRYEGDGDSLSCTVSTSRSGKVVSGSFSVADAKRAGLWGKAGPWSQYPRRMLYYRALGFLSRDHFSDVLFGFRVAEEERDIPQREERAVMVEPAEDPLLTKMLEAPAPELVEPIQLAPGEAEWAPLDEPPVEVTDIPLTDAEKVDAFATPLNPVVEDIPDNAEWLARVEELCSDKALKKPQITAMAKKHTASGALSTASVVELQRIANQLETL